MTSKPVETSSGGALSAVTLLEVLQQWLPMEFTSTVLEATTAG